MIKQKLQVYWIPQIPMKAFRVDVDSVTEGVKLMDVLGDYDLFQYNNKVKPDYANAGGLELFDEDDKEYMSWHIDFDVTIDGNNYSEYFEEPSEFLAFLEENNLTEQQIYAAMV